MNPVAISESELPVASGFSTQTHERMNTDVSSERIADTVSCPRRRVQWRCRLWRRRGHPTPSATASTTRTQRKPIVLPNLVDGESQNVAVACLSAAGDSCRDSDQWRIAEINRELDTDYREANNARILEILSTTKSPISGGYARLVKERHKRSRRWQRGPELGESNLNGALLEESRRIDQWRDDDFLLDNHPVLVRENDIVFADTGELVRTTAESCQREDYTVDKGLELLTEAIERHRIHDALRVALGTTEDRSKAATAAITTADKATIVAAICAGMPDDHDRTAGIEMRIRRLEQTLSETHSEALTFKPLTDQKAQQGALVVAKKETKLRRTAAAESLVSKTAVWPP